ncbi:MAG: hypothetical protein LBC87_08740 [Fibromonadaceae bacterium]|jgi:uncharacterized protein (TIGR02145 family)|nr:hypothetical protein [Fibromonadaceae bacterium]
MKTNRFLSAAIFALALAFTFSCSGGDDEGGGSGNNQSGGGGSCSISSGETVTIGSQTWMSKNLNCNVSGSVCYGNDPANCAIYGRLFNWEAAKKACSGGWHLPSDAEWEELMTAVGGSSTAGTKLKATSGWKNRKGELGNGTDDFGFSALPGGLGWGYGSLNGRFDESVGSSGYWWSATELKDSEASYHHMHSDNAHVNSISNGVKANFLSVRCVQD